MKIDIEGEEATIIVGCENLARNHKPRIIIEIMITDVIRFLRERDYLVFALGRVRGLFYTYSHPSPAGNRRMDGNRQEEIDPPLC